MDFASYQEKARKRSFWLIFLYTMGVFVIAGGAFLLVEALWAGLDYDYSEAGDFFYQGDYPKWALKQLSSPKFWYVVLAFVAFLAVAGGLKFLSLRGGGAKVAESLGATLVNSQSDDIYEKRLLNIVQEMALASGVPVPPVYLLKNEEGINAFAAGHNINDAVIGVTRGAIRLLNRDELQAVIAHEFSHILNGDMRLNLRFVSLLFGFLCISEIARFVMYGIRPSSGKDSKGGGIFILIVALIFYIAGLFTTFIGHIVQAAVNRQREFLADASAVQFTRTKALASALKKIGGFSEGSRLKVASADAYNHLFFGPATKSLYSTHPPLKERILRIDPLWDGVYPEPDNLDQADFIDSSDDERTLVDGFWPENLWQDSPSAKGLGQREISGLSASGIGDAGASDSGLGYSGLDSSDIDSSGIGASGTSPSGTGLSGEKGLAPATEIQGNLPDSSVSPSGAKASGSSDSGIDAYGVGASGISPSGAPANLSHKYSAQALKKLKGLALGAFMSREAVGSSASLAEGPKDVRQALKVLGLGIKEAWDASYILMSVFLDSKEIIAQKQLALVKNPEILLYYKKAMDLIPKEHHLNIIEQAVPTLKTLSPAQYEELEKILMQMIYADGQYSFKEWIFAQLVKRQLGLQYNEKADLSIRYTRLNQVKEAASLLLASLSRLSTKESDIINAYKAGLEHMGFGAEASLLAKTLPDEDFSELGKSLSLMQKSSPQIQASFLEAALKVAEYDHQVNSDESMYLRVLYLCLDTPIKKFYD